MKRKWGVRFSSTYAAHRPGAEVCYDKVSDQAMIKLIITGLDSGVVCTSIRPHVPDELTDG